MENIKIKLLLKANDGAVLFVEFIQDGRTKILSYDNFLKRYGPSPIEDLK